MVSKQAISSLTVNEGELQGGRPSATSHGGKSEICTEVSCLDLPTRWEGPSTPGTPCSDPLGSLGSSPKTGWLTDAGGFSSPSPYSTTPPSREPRPLPLPVPTFACLGGMVLLPAGQGLSGRVRTPVVHVLCPLCFREPAALWAAQLPTCHCPQFIALFLFTSGTQLLCWFL